MIISTVFGANDVSRLALNKHDELMTVFGVDDVIPMILNKQDDIFSE